MDASAGGECQTNAASVALKDSHAAKRANAETASLSAQQTRALQDARHRAEMAEAEARRSKAETITLATARLWAAPFFRIALENLAKCNSQADCQYWTKYLQAQRDVAKAMIELEEVFEDICEMDKRRASRLAERAEARLREERAEGALAAYRAESLAKRRRVDSEASS